MKIQLWKRKNYDNTKYNLYLRYRINQNKAKVESLKLWEWISPQSSIEISHNEEIQISCQEILRRAKDDIDNNRTNVTIENKNQYLFKNLFYKFSNINNTNAVFNFILYVNHKIEKINIEELDQKFLEETRIKIEEKVINKDIKGSTASKYWNNFKTVIINLNKLKLCEYPKVSGITYHHEEKKIRTFSDKEIEKIKRIKNSPLKTAFLFSCYTGTKLKILYELKWENIKNHKKRIYFIDFNISKKRIVVPFNKEIRNLLGIRRNNKSSVFQLMKEKNKISKEFSKIMLQLKISQTKKFSDGINTFAKKMYNKTKNIYLISSILGHNSIDKTKNIYSYMNEEDYLNKIYSLNINYMKNSNESKKKKLFKKGNLFTYKK